MIAKVEPLTSARALRGPFDYRLPGEMRGVEVGSMLVVPFARRRMLGVVVDLDSRSELPAGRLLEPLQALEDGVPAELVGLALWIADEYCSTPARGLALVLPPGTGRGERPRVRRRETTVATLTPAGRAALLPPGPGGSRDPVPRRGLGSRQRATLEALAGGPLPVPSAQRRAGSDRGTVRRLEARGLLTLERVEARGRRGGDMSGAGPTSAPARPDAPPERLAGAGRRLTPAQAAALERIDRLLDAAGGADRRLLLHGVTGSGKTEVYLRAAAAALDRGRGAIVLVPEIALTPQTAGRFRERFGERVAILHSKLGDRERLDEWLRLRRGQARVCVGPRSAIFAPVSRLGLVVIDEEHDPSFKHEGDPRYDARRVAERRAAAAGAVLVCGTATPRPETWLRLPRAAMPARVDRRRLPPVETVGMAGAPGPLHARTLELLEDVRRRRDKAIVLLNRRGWSNFLSCRACGRAWECPHCDVTLVLHRSARRLSCHHCGHSVPVPAACPDCGSVSLARHGSGTERLEHELADVLEPLPVLRLDSDVAGGRTAIADLLARFEAAPAGVLLGTQMVAKGHDFPDVTLGVVLDADATLRFPDFRAEERTFALVAQLAGRSGRGPRGGLVVVQALDPLARPLHHAARHDAQGFLDGELERRRALGYPPFSDLVRIVCSASGPGPEAAAARAVRERLEPPGAAVLGPAPLFRLKGRDRAQIVVKASDRAAALGAVRLAVAAVAADRGHRGVSFSVDVDPQ